MIPVAGLPEERPALEDDMETIGDAEAARGAEGASWAYCSVLSRGASVSAGTTSGVSQVFESVSTRRPSEAYRIWRLFPSVKVTSVGRSIVL